MVLFSPQGMSYLHNGVLRSHGHLTSNNCLIDNRWMLKVTGFGLGKIRHLHEADTEEIGEYQKYRGE